MAEAEIRTAVLRTLIYADLFDYPLTSREVHRFLIASRRVEFSLLFKFLSRIGVNDKQIGTYRGYYFIKGRKKIVSLRKKRRSWSEKKLKRARRVARWFRSIPTIRMIGVTGGLAMMNAGSEDDVDLIFVVSPQRLWLTRGLVVLTLSLLRRYRRSNRVKDRICPNLFLDEDHLEIPTKERNLFSAHEVAQIKCLWEKNGTYRRFLKKNGWILDFLPNAEGSVRRSGRQALRPSGTRRPGPARRLNKLTAGIENAAYRLQLAYMKPRRTREIVEPGRVFFHPNDLGQEVLIKYKRRLTGS